MANRWGNSGNSFPCCKYKADFILGGAPKSLQVVTAAMKLKDANFLEKKL